MVACVFLYFALFKNTNLISRNVLFNKQMFPYKITPNPFEPFDCLQPVISSQPSLIVLLLEKSLTLLSQPDYSNTSHLCSTPLSSLNTITEPNIKTSLDTSNRFSASEHSSTNDIVVPSPPQSSYIYPMKTQAKFGISNPKLLKPLSPISCPLLSKLLSQTLTSIVL